MRICACATSSPTSQACSSAMPGPALASGVTAIVFASPPSPRSTCAAAGRARARPTCSIRRIDGGAHRCRRAVGRLGLRARCGLRRAGLFARTGPRLCDSAMRGCRSCRGAILFDLLNGGDKNWGRYPPYRELGYAAAAAAGADFALGTAGAGFGATTVNLKGGLGSASAVTRDGLHGRRARRGERRRQRRSSATARISGRRRSSRKANSAASVCRQGFAPEGARSRMQRRSGENTTIAMVATDASAHQGAGQTIRGDGAGPDCPRDLSGPYTLDGDIVFAAATGRRPLADPVNEIAELRRRARTRSPGRWRGRCSRPLRCLAAPQAGRIATVRHFLTKGPEFDSAAPKWPLKHAKKWLNRPHCGWRRPAQSGRLRWEILPCVLQQWRAR